MGLFKEEVKERLDRVEEELLKRQGRDIELIYREFHTIKGTAQMLGFSNYSKAAHRVEDVVKPLWKQNMSLPGEVIPRLLKVLDIMRSRLGEDLSEDDLERIEIALKGEEVTKVEDETLGLEIVSEIDPDILERALDLSEEIMNRLFISKLDGKLLRLSTELFTSLRNLYWSSQTVLLSDVVKGFDRLVYEEAKRQGKEVELVVNVENVRVKKEIASPIRDSLVHIVKNAVVHGIEPPEKRKKLGKEEKGLISIRASVKGRTVEITVEDDGAGIDMEKIKKKLEEMGKEIPSDERELVMAIFEPFFSTKEKADMGGGRGIGLSSVKTFVESVGGEVTVESRRGIGMKFTLKIPSGRVWEHVAVFKTGDFIWASRIDDIDRVVLEEGSKNVFFKDGSVVKFTERVAMGNFPGLDNPFGRLENVNFWIEFMGIPVPVFKCGDRS